MHLTLKRLEVPGNGESWWGGVVGGDILLEMRRNGMRNCQRVDWKGDDDWIVKKIKDND